MAQLSSSSASPALRRRSDASATESLFYRVSERNQQEVRHAGNKRWTWGGAPAEPEVSFLTPPPTDQLINKQLSNSSTALCSPEKVPSNNNNNKKKKKKRNVCRRRSITELPEEPQWAEPLNLAPHSSSLRANSRSPTTPKRGKSNRKSAQSGQQLQLRAPPPEVRGHSTLERKTSKTETPEKKTPKSNNTAGLTDAEEASRVLMEKRRLAREQKEEQRRSQQEVKDLPERAPQQEDEDRRLKEQRWKEMQEQLDKDRELVVLRVKCEAQKKENEMQQLHLQAEQERQQRKKRINEIMKRTRKSDVESYSAESVCHVTSEDTEVKLDSKGCVDELSDGVQSMDVSPVSHDEPPRVQDFSLAEDTVGVPLDQSGCAGPGLSSSPSLLNRNLIVTSH